MNDTREIRIACVGAGFMATEHMKAFNGLPNVRIAGIFSRSHDDAARLAAAYGARVCNSVASLYAETQADLVVVTVTELSMTAIAEECFAFPWTVLLEKPAGYDMVEATRIRDAAQSQRRNVYVALNRRAYSSTRQALAALAPYSSQRFIRVIDQQDQQAAREIYGQPEIVARNYMFANSIHVIDYFRVFGRGQITAVKPIVPWTPDKPGLVLAQVQFSSGDVGLYEGIWDGPGPWAVSVNTAEQFVEMRPLEQFSIQLRGTRTVTRPEIDGDDTSYKAGLRFQAAQAVHAARGQPAQLATIDESWQSMKLVADIFGLG